MEILTLGKYHSISIPIIFVKTKVLERTMLLATERSQNSVIAAELSIPRANLFGS